MYLKTWKLLPILLLSGCSALDRNPQVAPVEVVTVTKPAPVYHPPLPSAVSALPVEWTVLTPQTMQEYLDDLSEGNAPTNAFYGLTTKGYENLSSNMADIVRYIRQLASIVDYYKNLESTDDAEEDK
jgi:hypothetical protein